MLTKYDTQDLETRFRNELHELFSDLKMFHQSIRLFYPPPGDVVNKETKCSACYPWLDRLMSRTEHARSESDWVKHEMIYHILRMDCPPNGAILSALFDCAHKAWKVYNIWGCLENHYARIGAQCVVEHRVPLSDVLLDNTDFDWGCVQINLCRPRVHRRDWDGTMTSIVPCTGRLWHGSCR